MIYLLHIGVVAAIYVLLAVSLDIVAGRTGLLSLAHAAFYGIGAYTSALMSVRLHVPFLVAMLAGMLMATLLSFVVSLPSLRLHDNYFVIATFGFEMIVFSVLNNWTQLTNGPLGIVSIPSPTIGGLIIDSDAKFLVLVSSFVAIAYLVVYRITTSPFCRVLYAIREDEVFAQALGKNTLRFKVSVFALSGMFAAMAGSLYAHYITFIDPTSFTVMESIFVLSIVIIGGAGSLWGPIGGAVVLVTVPEALRFMGLPESVAANLRQMMYGSLLVVTMVFRPRGLMGRYDFRR